MELDTAPLPQPTQHLGPAQSSFLSFCVLEILCWRESNRVRACRSHRTMPRACGKIFRRTQISVLGFGDSKWRTCIVCVFLTGLFPQKSPIICGSFAERDLQLNASYVSSPPCTCIATLSFLHVGHTFMHFFPSYPISFSDVTVLSRGSFLVLFVRRNTKKKDHKR